MSPFNRPKSLTELVTENLRERIIKGEIELGEQLSEARIAKNLEVSRTPVREAINRLEMEGLLVVEPQRGSFVFNLEPEELAKLCDARVCLETTAATSAMRTNPQVLHAALSACVERMKAARDAGDDAEYLFQDTLFHQCFFDCADNRFLNDAYQTIALKMAALRSRMGHHPDHMAKSYHEHMELVHHVGQDDVSKVLDVLKLHIDRKEGSYWSDATNLDRPIQRLS